MTALTIFTILSSLGMSLIITKSYIFEPIRLKFIGKEFIFTLLNCPQCMSFWTGLLCSATICIFTEISLPVLYCMGIALTSSLAGELIEKLFYENN